MKRKQSTLADFKNDKMIYSKIQLEIKKKLCLLSIPLYHLSILHSDSL